MFCMRGTVGTQKEFWISAGGSLNQCLPVRFPFEYWQSVIMGMKATDEQVVTVQ